MKAGTIVRMADGRIGTVVYNGLDGVGVKWGRFPECADEVMKYDSGLFEGSPRAPDDFPYLPDAMLRDPYPSAHLPCVGNDYETEGA